jgi:hypothetical protein
VEKKGTWYFCDKNKKMHPLEGWPDEFV